MTATLPDAELLVHWLIDQRTGSAVVGANQPANVAAHTTNGYLAVRRIGGGAIHGRMLDEATIDIQAYHGTRRAARDLCALASLALFEAWEQQTVPTSGGPAGHIIAHEELVGANELPTDIADVWRFQAQHRIRIRP